MIDAKIPTDVDFARSLVADLRCDARKIGVWSEVREDLLNAAELIEQLINEREKG